MDTWNTPAEPPIRKGMPTWGKVAMGCGIVSLLALGACVVGGVYVLKQSKTVIADMTRQPMQELGQLLQDSQTPEGLTRFYEGHQALAKRYPNAEAFAVAAKDLGARVGPLPTELADFITLMKEKRLDIKARNKNGVKVLTLKYRNPGKEALVGEWENGTLMDLRIE